MDQTVLWDQTVQLLSFVIPAAIGSAMSPTVLAMMTGILSQTQHPRIKGTAFLIGGVLSLLAWTAIVYSAIWAFLKNVENEALAHINVIDVCLGVLLLLGAAYLLIFKPRSLFKQSQKQERSTESAEGAELHIPRYASLGFVMEGRDISSIVLFIAALQHIGFSSVPGEIKVAVVALLIAITSLPMWLPLIAHVTIPNSFSRKAQPLLDWLRDHARVITIAVGLGFGVYLVVRGIIE